MNLKITNDVSKLKEEIEEYKFIHYKNVHVYPTLEIKSGLNVKNLNPFIKGKINILFNQICSEKNVSLEDKILKICEYRHNLETKLNNLQI